MHQVLVEIILDSVIEQYETENYFISGYLEIADKDWNSWKKGIGTLEAEPMKKIKGLFTDYEWMLVQKILRQTLLFPEKRNYAVAEYKRLKTMIAKKWIQSGGAMVELITQKDSYAKELSFINKGLIDLKISLNYGEWGYDDILVFRLPAIIQNQLEGSHIDLLEWVNENLTDTYMKENEE